MSIPSFCAVGVKSGCAGAELWFNGEKDPCGRNRGTSWNNRAHVCAMRALRPSFSAASAPSVRGVVVNLLAGFLIGVLPAASGGAILMPWVVGIVSEKAGLAAGMASNIVPCVGLVLFTLLVARLPEE